MFIKDLQPRIAKDRIPPFSVEIPNYKAVEGETIPRRNPRCIDKLIDRPDEGIETMFDVLKRAAEKFGNAKALGTRRLIKTHHEVKKIKKIEDGIEKEVDKKWTYFEMSGYEYISFYDFEQMALELGAGFRKIGLQKDDRVHIFAATSANWLGTAHGAISQSMPIVTTYDTLGEEGLSHSLKATKAKAIFLDPHLLPILINPLKEVDVDIRYVIWNSQNEVEQKNIDKLKQAREDILIISLEELRQLGKENPVAPVRPSPEDLCCIMYTSGSTGPPKGVPIKHKAVVASIAGVSFIVDPYVTEGDKVLTYLPLAHILEFVFENAALYWGTTLGYGNPKTLSDISMRNCHGDIRELKPNILIGVPAVWENIKKGILNKINASNLLVKSLFYTSLWLKNIILQNDLPGLKILDAIVFNKIRQATGGNLRLCLNGGGPISKDTQWFISMALTPLINGYGLTETTAMGAVMDPREWNVDSLGSLPGSIEIKLVDYSEAGYFATNRPNPQGEIWIRGTPVMEGYYLDEEETKKTITPDGWFKTGDIGEWVENGHLKIIDRKKNLVKTLNGEYIALEKLESIYRAANVVANICVYADPNRTKPVAIIVPGEPALKKLASSNNVDGVGVEDLSRNKEVQDFVLKQLQKVGRDGGLKGIEIIEGIVIADEEWTPSNGLTTSAQKLNRRAILEKYKKEIEAAYSRNG
ncbi:putative long-chain-fatty-acid- ligase 1 protein [Erysiphe necator]|uniref:Putative long-chain-fatty-acid-ligase 1 protein n=1 Tax=Uncinula necator TaxID=52586 RepID=A0A0B1P7J1_UNCNE|nr:putative long-chain-fatty-acid- ligase 1 protein [Erysiphe necator]